MKGKILNGYKKLPLLIAVIILFLMRAWPLATALLLLYFVYPRPMKNKKVAEEETIESLKKENQALREELADQAVRHAMDRAENREKKD